MTYFGTFYLDNEKDMIVRLYKEGEKISFVLKTPNHHTGNLIRNFAALCSLSLRTNHHGMMEAYGDIPAYYNGENRLVYIFRLNNTKVANIYPDGRIEKKANVSAIAKTLMSQTKDYRLPVEKTIFKTFIPVELKFRSDLHTHMNGNLTPDVLIALGIAHQIRYPLYYIRKLGLVLTKEQEEKIEAQRKQVEEAFRDSELQGKYRTRKIDDHTYINFADLILNNPYDSYDNIAKIRNSLAILKDGQAVFTNLEKVYLYRYVFCKGAACEEKTAYTRVNQLPDDDIRRTLERMLEDRNRPEYAENTLFQDKLLWIARGYQEKGIHYAEISDTTLVKKKESIEMLRQVHEVMPAITRETGVTLRFLAALRRIPLTIVKDQVTSENYLLENLEVLKATARDPYVAGCDFVGEEINDIIELKPAIAEIVKIAAEDPGFVIRIHAGENDSLKDNMSHSISCVKDSLIPGQNMPVMRIGHGLYAYALNSRKGRQLLKEIRENDVTLEFQITSNVRLNNISTLRNHPLKDYLREGIQCVQGTDGAALYGTSSIDEQLALEKLLDLSCEEMEQMKKAETSVVRKAMEAFENKKRTWDQYLSGRDFCTVLKEEIERKSIYSDLFVTDEKVNSASSLESRIAEMPLDKIPVVLVGGSFNNDKRGTRVTAEGARQMDLLLEVLDPDQYFFVIGHKLRGYEEYLLKHNTGKFTVYSIVPSLITEECAEKLKNADVFVRISPEAQEMAIYKSFNYEIFERRPSVVVAFDGNSAALNLIQEARNGKGKAKICLFGRSSSLKAKEGSLEGYVSFFDEKTPIDDVLRKEKQLWNTDCLQRKTKKN